MLKNSRLRLLYLVGIVALVASSDAALASPPPNIVFFLVDDLGWGAMSDYGNNYHETPNFDELCARGTKFTHAYSACTVCSPSRAAILTGQYPARLHLTDFIPGHPRPKGKLSVPNWSRKIDPSAPTLANSLQQHGYDTWFLGKWHLMPVYRDWSKEQSAAARAKHTPQVHGFDVNIGGREWGQPKGRGRYFYPFDMPGLREGHDGEYLTDRLTDEAIQLLDAKSDAPFLLYLSYYTVHTPVVGKPELADYFRSKNEQHGNAPNDARAAHYAAMHKSLDESIGRVLAKIEEIGETDNTIVIFTGDNGGDRHSACGGLRGRKAMAYEGGVRVPTCVVWPRVTPPDSVCDTPIIGMDFYPTLLEAAGADALPGQTFDGVSLVPLLDGSDSLDRDALYWHYPHYHRTTPYCSVRHGHWKLIEFFEDGELQLFDLEADPREQRNLAAEEPKKRAQLREMLHRWRQDVGAQLPIPNPARASGERNES